MPAGDVVLEPNAGTVLKAFTQDLTPPIHVHRLDDRCG